MTKSRILFALCWLPFAVSAQVQPMWVDANTRASQFPASVYLTGFASGSETLEKAKTAAQTSLLENLRVVITSKTSSSLQSVSYNDHYDELDIFSSSAEKTTEADIAGMTVETYTDPKTKTNFAFAYVNKYELIGYYKANLTLQLQQAQSALNTAEQLENSGEKAKARRQCEEALPLVARIRAIQDLLIALDNTANSGTLKVAETEQMRNSFTQMQARLAQGVYVYVESSEKLFNTKVDIVANQVKAVLAKKGCSFVDAPEQADFRLTINVTTRQSSDVEGIVFCYADTQVELYDIRKQRVVYSDEIAQKAGSVSQDKAARKAMSDVVPKISEKLKSWIEN